MAGKKDRTVDLTIEILKQIRDNTEATNRGLGEVKVEMSGLKTEMAEVRREIDVLVRGQYDLAQNVSLLNGAVTRLAEEVRFLRDEKYTRLDERVTRLERHAGI